MCVVVYPYLREKKSGEKTVLPLKRRRLLSQFVAWPACFFLAAFLPDGRGGWPVNYRVRRRNFLRLHMYIYIYYYYGYTTIIARANTHHRKVEKRRFISISSPFFSCMRTPKLNDVVFQLQRVANSPYATRRAQRVLRNGYEIVRPTDVYFPVRHGADAKHDGFFIFF